MVFNVAVCKSKRNACWDQLVETEAHCLSLLWHEGKVCTRGGLLACFIYPISIFGMQKKQFDLLYIWRYASSSLSEAFLLYNRTLPLLHVPDTTHFYEPGIKRVKLSLQHLKKKKKNQQRFHQVLCWGDWQNIPSKISILAASPPWSLDKAACVRKATQFELGGHMRTWEHRLWS